MLQKRVLLIIIDSLRYDYSHLLGFKGYNKLLKVVALSNWTAPSVMAMVTGQPVTKNRGGVGCQPDNTEWDVPRLASGKKDRQTEYPTLFQDFDKSDALYEVPFFFYLNKKVEDEAHNFSSMLSHMKFKQTINSAYSRIKKYRDEKSYFLYLHFKGPHEPYSYDKTNRKLGNEAVKYKPDAYEREIMALKDDIEQFVADVDDEFDQVIICADHGTALLGMEMDREHLQKYKYGHGNLFHNKLLHIPVWVKDELPDLLYENTIIYDLIKGNKIIDSEVVVSNSPVRGMYNRIGITYNSPKGLVTDEVTTSHLWKL